MYADTKLIKLSDNHYTEEGKENSVASQYYRRHHTIYLKLYSLQYASSYDFTVVPQDLGEDDGDSSEIAKYFEDKENTCKFQERIEAIGEIEKDEIHIINSNEEETSSFSEIDIQIRPVFKKKTGESDQLNGEDRDFAIMKAGSSLIHFCENLRDFDRGKPCLYATLYIPYETFQYLCEQIKDENRSQISSILLGLRAPFFQLEMESDLNEIWMRDNYLIERNSSTKCVMMSLRISHGKALARKYKQDDDDPDSYEDEEMAELSHEEKLQSSIKDILSLGVKMVKQLTWMMYALIAVAAAIIFK